MQKLKPGWLLPISLIGLLSTMVAATTAATAPDMQPAVEPCHALMTEQECGQFKTAQAKLKSGHERDHFLAAHHLLRQEREAACNCNQKVMSRTVYPQRQQALLQY